MIELLALLFRLFMALLSIGIFVVVAAFALWLVFWIVIFICQVLILIAPIVIAVLFVGLIASMIRR
jgi:hypothetical protein